MKTLLYILLTLVLTGCGTCTSHCIAGFGPGNKVFDAMGNHYNSMDPCQHIGKPEGHVLPDFCFANAGKKVYYVRDVNNRIIYKIQ